MSAPNLRRASHDVPASDLPRWHWPIDLTRYDRTPELTPIEYEALDELGWDLRRGRLHDPNRPTWPAIARLLQPLDDARLSLSIPPQRYHRRSALDAIALILHACRTLRTTLWTWSPERWIEVFGPDQHTFQSTYVGWVDGSVRPYMVAMAYLLDCFSAFQLLGPFNRVALAIRVFGPARVAAAVDPIMTVLRDWAISRPKARRSSPGSSAPCSCSIAAPIWRTLAPR